MSTPTPIIINTDPGIDDILAITMALSHSDRVKIEAICLTHGNTTIQNGRDNIIRLFCVLHQHITENPYEEGRSRLAKSIKCNFESEKDKKVNQILLAKGSSNPLKGSTFDASHFHGQDGLSDISSLPGNPWPLAIQIPTPLTETKKNAYEVILDTLKKNPINTVRIVSLGPLTNLALAWLKDPVTFARVGGISMMGGALDVPGNDTPCAEYNAFADPFAIRVLLQDAPQHPILKNSGKRLPFDMLPLDITKEHKVPFSRLCNDGVSNKGILQKFFAAILARPRQLANSKAPDHLESVDKEKYDMFQAHDPLAMAHTIFCPSAVERQQTLSDPINGIFADWQIKTRVFGMETDGYLTRGQCVVDRRTNANDKSFTVPVKKIRRRSIQVIPNTNPREDIESPGVCSSSSSSYKAPTENGTLCKSPLRDRFSPSSFPQSLRRVSSFIRSRRLSSEQSTTPPPLPSRQIVQEDREEQARPLNGSWDVVVASPGLDWFVEEFLTSLSV